MHRTHRSHATILAGLFALVLSLASGCRPGLDSGRRAVGKKSQSQEEKPSSPGAAAVQEAMKSQQVSTLIIGIQSSNMPDAEDVRREVAAFMNTPAYSNSSKIVWIDPADPAEKDFLRQLRINPDVKIPVTMVMAAPSRVLDVIHGPVSRGRIAALVSSYRSRAASSCG